MDLTTAKQSLDAYLRKALGHGRMRTVATLVRERCPEALVNGTQAAATAAVSCARTSFDSSPRPIGGTDSHGNA